MQFRHLLSEHDKLRHRCQAGGASLNGRVNIGSSVSDVHYSYLRLTENVIGIY